MFKVDTYQAPTATLTPTKLLMDTSVNNTDWSFNRPATMAGFSYMNEINPFDAASNFFDQKVQSNTHNMMMMPPSPEDDNYSTNTELVRPPAPLTPPSATSDTPPRKQRKKLLEKNREAAYRCRQKKKKWIHDLEEKSVTFENRNKELQEQVSQLREESIYLRNLLLTHGNCDCEVVVSLYMKKE
ncbi:uncharacterized protein B0P05DRAFT_564754 [Gilbertella persicaria]|uniref:uncharacterized protein n=1 Tax=Gilbertella persicaria TaxID=101096 RepID=UPI00221E9486|nr:uncharacterized protein B0P05DRAFT_564754 [Gilbertella persicaria]KAI8048166.1 hypothetical protein B0P05DRAFT_564754 [Gilbertella persicaria]